MASSPTPSRASSPLADPPWVGRSDAPSYRRRVVRIPEHRQDRRRAKRLARLALAMTPELPPELRHGHPRYGVRARPAVEGAKFGAADPRSGDERRQAERRNTSLTAAQVEVRMKALGISTDRRTGDRRGADRRR
jgi:hypothetical protein